MKHHNNNPKLLLTGTRILVWSESCESSHVDHPPIFPSFNFTKYGITIGFTIVGRHIHYIDQFTERPIFRNHTFGLDCFKRNILKVFCHIVTGACLPADLPGLALEALEDGDVAVVGGGPGADPAVARVHPGHRGRARGLRHVQRQVVHDVLVLHHLQEDYTSQLWCNWLKYFLLTLRHLSLSLGNVLESPLVGVKVLCNPLDSKLGNLECVISIFVTRVTSRDH